MKVHIRIIDIGLHLLCWSSISWTPCAGTEENQPKSAASELIAQIGSPDGTIKYDAVRKLEKVGWPAFAELTKATKSGRVDVAHCSTELVRKIVATSIDCFDPDVFVSLAVLCNYSHSVEIAEWSNQHLAEHRLKKTPGLIQGLNQLSKSSDQKMASFSKAYLCVPDQMIRELLILFVEKRQLLADVGAYSNLLNEETAKQATGTQENATALKQVISKLQMRLAGVDAKIGGLKGQIENMPGSRD